MKVAELATGTRMMLEGMADRALPSDFLLSHKVDMLRQAKAATAQFQEAVLNADTLHAQTHAEARKAPHLADHAEPHFIRQGLWRDYINLASSEIQITDEDILAGSLLFEDHHDANQLDIAFANSQRSNGDQLNPRSGSHHEVGGALQLLARVDEYQQATGVTREQAQRRVAFGALMILFHDSHDILRPSLTQTAKKQGLKAYTYQPDATGKYHKQPLHGEALISLFEPINYGPREGEIQGCDLTSLSPSQIVELVQHFKEKDDPRHLSEKTPFGLDEAFETSHGEILQRLAKDETPLFDNLSRRQRKQFILALDTNVAGDVLEQVLPGGLGLLRTLSNGHARQRPLYNDRTYGDLPYTVDLSPKGDTDLARKLREVLILADVIQNSRLAKTRFAREILPAMLIQYLSELKEYGITLMGGHDPEDTRTIQERIRDMVSNIWSTELSQTANALATRSQVTTEDDAGALESLQRDLSARVQEILTFIGDSRKYRREDITQFRFEPDRSEADLANENNLVFVEFSPERLQAFVEACDEVIYGPQDTEEHPNRIAIFNSYKGKPGFKPRYLAQYAFARDFFKTKAKPPTGDILPYDSYIQPGATPFVSPHGRRYTL